MNLTHPRLVARAGVLNERLGGSKRFRCASCAVRMDRDANVRRNILLRFICGRGDASLATGSTFSPHDSDM